MTETITEALARFRCVAEADGPQRDREDEDLRFQIPSQQWPADVQEARKSQVVNGLPLPARPMLSFPTLDQPVQLVLNQERSAKLGVEVHPLSEDAADDTAEILQGLYRRIEVDSRAGLARTWAFDRAVKAGRGAYRVLTEYADDEGGHPSDQRIVIKRLLYQGCVYLDPFAQEPDWSDGEWGFVIEDMPWSKYKRRFPNSQLAASGSDAFDELATQAPEWMQGDNDATRTIRVAEYFRKVYTKKQHVADGEWEGRDYDDCVVMWSIINAVEELTPAKVWPGKYIPLIPVIGRELQPVDGKRVWVGIIGPNKDAARTVNYSASGMVESAALEPRAPFDIDPEEIEGYESYWQQANVRNFPFLPRHKFLRGQPTGELKRIQADTSKLGMNAALLQMATDQVQRGTGAFDPTLGRDASSNDSGRKVQALQQQHDQGSGDFLDSLAELSLTLEAKVVLDLIPKIYDRPGRVARILGIEDAPQTVMLNQPFRMDPQSKRPIAVPSQPPGQAGPSSDVKHYDLTKGRYAVTVTVNKRYESRLQQGAEEIGQIMQAQPALIPIIGPTYFKFRDGPGMREIAELLKKMRDHEMPWLSDEQDQQGGDPQQKVAQLTQENAMLKQVVQGAQKAIEGKQIEQQGKVQIAQLQESGETARNRENNETKLAVAELGAKFDRLALFLEERARLGVQVHEVGMAQSAQAHERSIIDVGQQHALEQGAQGAVHQSVLGQEGHQQAMQQGDLGHQQALSQQQQAADLAPAPTEGA